MLKQAIERANKLMGGWPEDEAIIGQLEGMGYDAPSGYLYIRPDNHQGYKDAVTGFSKNNPEYPFPTWNPNRIITIPIRNITAPANWPKPGEGHDESTAAADSIKSLAQGNGLKATAATITANHTASAPRRARLVF